MTFTDYTSTAAGSAGGSPAVSKDDGGYPSLGKLKKQYLDYLSTKRAEIDEQIQARRYRHGAHYTAEQIEAFRRRRQPVVTYNRIGRKIDGVVGLVEKMRLDPKAYPRTPKHEQGAELATAVIRYCMDEQEWKAKSPICAGDAATDGIGGVEIEIERGDQGDAEIGFDIVDPDGFFYDPRSTRMDFSDARFMGVGKWMDIDQAKDLFPDKAEDLDSAIDGSELTSNSDRDQKWYSSEQGRVRVVDHWYRHKGEWCWTIYTGSMKLMEGKSYLTDEKKKTECKYIMFSANVDHDGDRYGFVRNLKSANDEINARRSKGLHELNTRRIIAEEGAFNDIEVARREAARPDGVVIHNPGLKAEFDDSAKMANIAGQREFLQDAKDEIENFGPNPALIGTGVEAKSGRAIALMQQAGIAELGPYILALRGWKLRVYRAVFNAIQQHWTGERWIRVTDDNDLAQFIQVNGIGTDPQTGMPAMVNAIGSLDVDIILDEGADSITIAQEANEVLGNVLSSVGPMLSPGEARAAVQILIDTSALPSTAKKAFRDAGQQAMQPNPMAEKAKMIELATGAAKVDETAANTKLKEAQTVKTMMEAHQPPDMPQMQMPEPQPFELPPEIQVAQAAAEIDATHAKADHTRAQTNKTALEAAMAPHEFAHNVFAADADRSLAETQAKQRSQPK